MRILKLVLFILMIFSLTGVVVGAGYDWIRPLSSGSSNCSNNYSHVNINDPSYFVSSINIKAQTDDKIINIEKTKKLKNMFEVASLTPCDISRKFTAFVKFVTLIIITST